MRLTWARNDLGMSKNLTDLLMKNSSEENWPAAFKTEELRQRNKEMIKQMKGRILNIFNISVGFRLI